jgi:hypothetical protein
MNYHISNTLKLPTPADKIVADFVDKISNIRPQFIEGIYLTGSLSMNDFFSNKSDIDFLILCKKLPDPETATQLKYIHKQIAKRYPKPDLSGSYLSVEDIKNCTPGNIKTLTYHERIIRYSTFEMGPINLAELKVHALTIVGQKAETLPVMVNENDLVKFLYQNINSYWKNWINRHSTSLKRKLLLLFFPRLTEWAILGVARQLFTLQTGKIVSKTGAGVYCLQHLPPTFHPILKEAIEIRKDNTTYPFVKSYALKPSFRRMRRTIECVNYMIATFNDLYSERQQNFSI